MKEVKLKKIIGVLLILSMLSVLIATAACAPPAKISSGVPRAFTSALDDEILQTKIVIVDRGKIEENPKFKETETGFFYEVQVRDLPCRYIIYRNYPRLPQITDSQELANVERGKYTMPIYALLFTIKGATVDEVNQKYEMAVAQLKEYYAAAAKLDREREEAYRQMRSREDEISLGSASIVPYYLRADDPLLHLGATVSY